MNRFAVLTLRFPPTRRRGRGCKWWLCLWPLALVACRPDPSGAATAGQAAAAKRPVPVTAAVAWTTNVPVELQGIGTVHAYSTVSVKSKIPGEIAQIAFREGEEVKAGDLIVRIDPRPYEGALAQAKANLGRDRALLAKAQADFRRAAELLKGAVISQAEFDADRASMDSLAATILADDAAINNAKVQLDYCYIRSPINGRLGTLLVNQGNIVKDLDTVMVVINQLRPIYVDFAVPEQSLPEIRAHLGSGHLPVEARIPWHPGQRAVGELEMIDNQVDSTTGTIRLRARFSNADELLWPGQFVDVSVTLALQTNVVVVPTEAIQDGQEGQYVCVVKPDQTVEFRPVELGTSSANGAVVKKGLRPGEQIVTSGQLGLIPGATVVIKPPATGPGAESSGAS